VPAVPASSSGSAVSIPFCGGAGLYRRAVLEKVGNFNPYLYSDEEPDLCLRMRVAGYSIVRLEQPLVKHYSDMRESFSTVVGRCRRNLHLGQGQNLRYMWGTKYFWHYAYERGHALVPGLALLAGIFSLAWWLGGGQARYFQLWLALVGTVLVVDAIRKRSLYLPWVSLFKRLVAIGGSIRGFLMQPLPPAGYPSMEETVPSVLNSEGQSKQTSREFR